MSLAVMEMMMVVVVDNQNAADVLHWWEPFCGCTALPNMLMYILILQTSRDRKIILSVGFEAASE